ncbi:hypothetical protein LTR65_002323 [Meristemomyces frigidus]
MDLATTTTSGRSNVHLHGLPREIQDIIFEYAYPPVADLKLVDRRQWEFREKQRRMEASNTHEVAPFPSSKVNDFMVSKEFFAVAAEAYMKNNSTSISDNASYLLTMTMMSGGITAAYLTHVKVLLMLANQLPSLPKLQRLTLTMSPADFDVVKTNHPLIDELDPSDFAQLNEIEYITKLRGLQEVRVQSVLHVRAVSDDQKHTLQANMDGLKAFLEAHVKGGTPGSEEHPEVGFLATVPRLHCLLCRYSLAQRH